MRQKGRQVHPLGRGVLILAPESSINANPPRFFQALHALFEAKGSLLLELSSSWQAEGGAGAPTAAALRERGLAELFAEFCVQRTGNAPDEAEQALLARAAELALTAELRLPPEPAQIEALRRQAGM